MLQAIETGCVHYDGPQGMTRLLNTVRQMLASSLLANQVKVGWMGCVRARVCVRKCVCVFCVSTYFYVYVYLCVCASVCVFVCMCV